LRFVLVDKILELDPSRRIVTSKKVAADEDYFADHFPGYPVVPGVLLVEMIAQTAGKCLMAGIDHSLWPVLLQVRQAIFRKSVRPESSLLIEASIESNNQKTASALGNIKCEKQLVAEASLLFGFIPKSFLRDGYEDEILNTYLAEQKSRP
jgi:3-hydroxyacyl-[acyl-carrier-protein] dehydratase